MVKKWMLGMKCPPDYRVESRVKPSFVPISIERDDGRKLQNLTCSTFYFLDISARIWG
jgi:hypothetical protein